MSKVCPQLSSNYKKICSVMNTEGHSSRPCRATVCCFLTPPACVCSHRLEFPDGLSLSVPQLARLCVGVCLPLRGSHLCSHHHAWEPSLLSGGQTKRATSQNVFKISVGVFTSCSRQTVCQAADVSSGKGRSFLRDVWDCKNPPSFSFPGTA